MLDNGHSDRLLRVLMRQPVDRTPVWIMRQAGRYLPEYRAIRSRVQDFMGLCRSPELACEVALQPLRRYPQLDAAIVFSDILTIPDAMGMEVRFVNGGGPQFGNPIRLPADIARLRPPDVESDLAYVSAAVRMTRRELDGRLPLIGFSGSPWTLACYMIEGGGSKHFPRSKSLLYSRPDLLHQLLQMLAEAVSDYLSAQIEAGAQVVQIFDSWGGILGEAAFDAFSLAYIHQIISNLRRQKVGVPIIFYTRGGALCLQKIAAVGADALGLDWTVGMARARQQVGDNIVLQGNLDPAVLLGSHEIIKSEAERIMDCFDNHQGHIFNLGGGVTPDVDPDSLAVLLETVASHGCQQ